MFTTFKLPVGAQMAFYYHERGMYFTMGSTTAPRRMRPAELVEHLMHTRALCERASEMLTTFERVLQNDAYRAKLGALWPM